MAKIVDQVNALTNGYVRHGGKDNRRQQRARMLDFAEHCAAMGVREVGQIGGRHVISWWHSHQALSEATLYAHWLAIRELWRLAQLRGDPPKPRGGVAVRCV